MEKILSLLLSCALIFVVTSSNAIAGEGKYQRNYNKSLSTSDKKDITTIIKTLAWSSLPKLLAHKSSLQKAGDRIRPVHPLRFLEFVFSNDELKAGAHAIRNRTTFVWGEFWSGLSESLEDESKNGNLTTTHIADFSNRVGVSAEIITPAIQGHHWQDFFDLLLQHIPRNQNSDRYNM